MLTVPQDIVADGLPTQYLPDEAACRESIYVTHSLELEFYKKPAPPRCVQLWSEKDADQFCYGLSGSDGVSARVNWSLSNFGSPCVPLLTVFKPRP